MVEPVHGSSRRTAAAHAAPSLRLAVFQAATEAQVHFKVNGATKIVFTRTPLGVGTRVAIDGGTYTGGIMQLTLGSPAPPDDARDDLRSRVFASAAALAYGVDRDSHELAEILARPAIAAQRNAYLGATRGPVYLVMPG